MITSENYAASPASSPGTASPSTPGPSTDAPGVLVSLDKDRVFQFPGRSRDANGRFVGFVLVTFWAARRDKAELSVTLDGSTPRCVAGQAYETSVSRAWPV